MCQHLRTVVDDHTATVICTDCGLVLDERVITYETPNVKTLVSDKLYPYQVFIFDVCDRYQIFSQAAFDALELISKWISTYEPKRYDYEAFCALSIYHSLRNHGVPRPFKEVAEYCGVDFKQMWKMESKIHPKMKSNSLHELLKSSTHKVGLSIKDHDTLLMTLKQLELKHFSPNNVVASLLYLYCKMKGHKITMRTVANCLKVSSMSVYRCVKHLKNCNVNCILESNVKKL